MTLPMQRLAEPAPTLSVGDAALRVAVIGGLSITVAGTPVALANRKARGILAYLAMEGGGPVARERLAGLLWPDAAEKQARNSLRQALFELREALDARSCPALLATRDAVALSPEHLRLDLADAVAEIAAGRVPAALSQAVRAGTTLATYEDLSPLFADWVMATRQSVVARLTRALEHAFADAALPRRDRRALAEAALRLDPLHEDACRAVMRLAAEDGEIGIALRAYTALYELLGVELDMEPSAATQQLVAEIKRGDLAPAEPLPPPAPAIVPRRRTLRAAPEDTPVLAVLPFRPIGPDPLPDYLGEGIVEDIVANLAALREPAVISTNSTRRFRGPEADDLARIGVQLGADYFLTGSLRAAGSRTRIAVELAEASQGAVLWGRSTEVEQDALFDAQAEIAAGVANTLVPRLNEAELRMSRTRPPDHLGAYHLVLRARDQMFELTPFALDHAGDLLRRAAAADPDYAPVHAARMHWHSLRIFQGWSADLAADAGGLEEAGRVALRLDPNHARALAMFGHNRTIVAHAYSEALDLFDRAVAAAPNDAETLCFTSPTLAYVGRTEEAISRAGRALALSPQDPFLFRYEHFLAIAHYANDDMEAAAQWGLRSAGRNPNYTSNLRFTVAALAALDRRAEVEPLVTRLLQLQPRLRVSAELPRFAFKDRALAGRHAANLRKAGVPG